MALCPKQRKTDAPECICDYGKLRTLQSDAIKAKLQNLTEAALQQTTMIRQLWCRDDANSGTLYFISGHTVTCHCDTKKLDGLLDKYRSLWTTVDISPFWRVALLSMTDSDLHHAKFRGQSPS